jgi:predicted RNA-binding Zn-ribbon protein involved in translation (DUF1610 family)
MTDKNHETEVKFFGSYTCPHCARTATYDASTPLHSGLTLTCEHCGEKAIIELLTADDIDNIEMAMLKQTFPDLFREDLNFNPNKGDSE